MILAHSLAPFAWLQGREERIALEMAVDFGKQDALRLRQRLAVDLGTANDEDLPRVCVFSRLLYRGNHCDAGYHEI